MKVINNYLLTLFLLLALSLEGKIVETSHIEDIFAEVKPGTLVLLDVDDTLIYVKTALGSRKWIHYIESKREDISANAKEKMPHVFPIDDAFLERLIWNITRVCHYSTVESGTTNLIHRLQSEDKVVVMGLTTRSNVPVKEELEGTNSTSYQLKEVGIDFTESVYGVLRDPCIDDGIIFTAFQEKGPVLSRLLKQSSYKPSLIIFVDDKKSHIDSVNSAMKAMGIPCICYWYTQVSDHGFAPQISDIQLQKWVTEGKMLSNEEAEPFIGKEDVDMINYFLKFAEQVKFGTSELGIKLEPGLTF